MPPARPFSTQLPATRRLRLVDDLLEDPDVPRPEAKRVPRGQLTAGLAATGLVTERGARFGQDVANRHGYPYHGLLRRPVVDEAHPPTVGRRGPGRRHARRDVPPAP